MEEANGAKKSAAPSQLKATRATARRMVAAGAVKRRAASSQPLIAARTAAGRTVEANGAKKRAVPSPLEATRVPFSLE
jgi:hypothetical protein